MSAHTHTHDDTTGGHAHGHDHGRASATAIPARSLLRMSAMERLAIAGGFVAAIWLAVAWALA